MRKITLRIIALSLVACMAFALSSCSVMDFGAMLGQTASGTGTSGNEDYMTEEEVRALLDGIEKNVTIEGGDNITIGNITSNHEKNLLAASRGLLSAVSILSTFEVTYTYSGGFGYAPSTTTKEVSASGAGIIYKLDKASGNAYIITNYHVVYEASSNTADHISDNIKVFLYGQEYADYAITAEYIGGSANYDIAVLKVSGSEILMKSIAVPATFADSDDVSVLDTAIAIGNPKSNGISATVGTVNVDSERINISSVDGNGTVVLRVIRIDAAVNGGNSGGGLFNDEGEVIGVVNAKMSDSSIDNIGYAIPSNVAKNVADNIIYYDEINASVDSVQRVMLGIDVAISEAYAAYDEQTGKIHKVEKVVISGVTAGGAADGVLAVDDVINSITIDGITYDVTRNFHVIDAMLNARRTDSFASTVVFNVTRGGTVTDIAVDISSVVPESY